MMASCSHRSPFGTGPAPLPGLIEAENYDQGGENTGYHDTSAGNESGEYRKDDVDVGGNGSGGYAVSSIDMGEWLEYTVDATAGSYYIEARVASALGGGSFHIAFDGKDTTGKISFTRTGGSLSWETLKIGPIALAAGKKTMRVTMDTRSFNIDWFRFTATPDAPAQNLPVRVTSTAPILSSVPWLRTEGKWIKDPSGNKVALYGVAIPDLTSLYNDAKNPPHSRRNKTVFDLLDMLSDKSSGWHSRIVRMTIPPQQLGDETNTELEFYFNEILDPAVRYAAGKGLYVVIDWHYINSDMEDPGIAAATDKFWSFIAPRYANLANVVFDIVNEPGKPADWSSYRKVIGRWVNLIRSHAPDNLILIGGPAYATTLPQPSSEDPQKLLEPIESKNIVYICHVYPGIAMNQSADVWQQLFGATADAAPLMVSEWGWEYGAPIPCSGLESSWGGAFKKYLDSKENVGWIAWCFDNSWHPVMFDTDWKLLGGDKYMGEFVKQWLYEKKDSYQFQMK
jgi:endoglucanase